MVDGATMPMGIACDAWGDMLEKDRMSRMLKAHADALRSTADAIRSGRSEAGAENDTFCQLTDPKGKLIGTMSKTESFAGWTSRRFETNLMPPDGTADGLRSKLLLVSVGGPFGSLGDPDCLEAWASCQTAIAVALDDEASSGIAARMKSKVDMLMRTAPALATVDGIGRLTIRGPIMGSDPLILTDVLMEDSSYRSMPWETCLPADLRSEPWLPLFRIRKEDTAGMNMLVVSSIRERKDADHDPIAIMRAVAQRDGTAPRETS